MSKLIQFFDVTKNGNTLINTCTYLTVHIQFKIWRIPAKGIFLYFKRQFFRSSFPAVTHRLGGAWPHVIISHSDLKVCACLKLLFVTIYLLPYILAPIHLSPTLFDCQKRKFHLPVEFNPNSSTHLIFLLIFWSGNFRSDSCKHSKNFFK